MERRGGQRSSGGTTSVTFHGWNEDVIDVPWMERGSTFLWWNDKCNIPWMEQGGQYSSGGTTNVTFHRWNDEFSVPWMEHLT
jgi:hypothetical protein